MPIQPLKAIQFTGENDAEIQAWLPEGVTFARFVDLGRVSVELLPKRHYGFAGEIRQREWLILQSDGRLRRVSDGAFKQTWRRRLPYDG